MASKNFKVYIPLIILVLIVLAGGVYWYIDYSKYVKTDDAFVTSDVVTVSPKIMGRVSKLYVNEGDSVQAGELIAELDSTDLLAQKQQILASKQQAEAGKIQSVAKYDFDTKSTEVLKISLDRAKEDYDRARLQFSGGVITKEQFDHVKKSFETANAQYQAGITQLNLSKSQINSAQATVISADAQIHVINTQLGNTRLYAPVNGVVAKRWLLSGDMVSPGQSIFTINNNSRFWVMVYLEETKLETLKIGQDAVFTLDMYPGLEFSGKVFMIGSTTASQFALIPASNASGNFTKVTQRIPLKISIDKVSDGDLNKLSLTTGMSAVVKIVR